MEHKAQNYLEAERLLRTALRCNPDDIQRAWIMSDLALTLDRLNRPPTEIEEMFKKSLELNPNNAPTNYYYSLFLKSHRRNKEAESYYKVALKNGWRIGRPASRRR